MENPTEQRADKRGADSVERLVRPFLRSNTSAWEERSDIRDALEDMRNHSDELLILLESGENRERNLPQAMNAFRDLETAVRRLWPNNSLH